MIHKVTLVEGATDTLLAKKKKSKVKLIDLLQTQHLELLDMTYLRMNI